MAISLKTTMWVVVIFGLVTLGSLNVKAQSPTSVPAPGPGTSAPDCMTLIYNTSDCLTFVEKGSKLAKPDKSCCPELSSMLDTNPICLCQLLGKSKDFGIELDLRKSLKLPSVCGLQAPDVSLCSEVGIPVGAPSAGGPTSSEGPSSASPVGMTPEAAEASAGKKEASSAHFIAAYLVAGSAMALLLKL